ncbi:N-acetylmuramoyl-L-alanine amidase [Vulcaniibacterium gelatinicum]|uniref:N-acetylmuramoyl-L-alanine amidase n=1 Tax=Vulcaniibacterium gelatinicum TaxID=2598725 RepID=UPI0011CBD4B3
MLQQMLLGAALVLALVWNLVHAGEIRQVTLRDGPTGTRAELLLDAPATYSTLRLSSPERLVVDLPGTPLRAALPAGAGVVKGVRSGQPQPGTTRIVFDLATPVAPIGPRLEAGAGGHRLVIEWPGDGGPQPVAPAPATVTAAPMTTATAAPAPSAATPAAADPATAAAASAAMERLIASLPAASAPEPAPVSATPGAAPGANPPAPAAANPSAAVPAPPAGATKTAQQVMRGGMRPLIIAIDAGHGGQDPGARGPSGTREKDLTLAIARELARQVDATPGLRAFLTRDSDVFIPLAQRYQKARAAKADLFVSIHADAFTNPEASGSSVFVLSPRGASSQAARWLANQENAADLVGGVRLHDKDDTLASVLLDLSQSATMKASEDIANHVLSGLKRLGKTHKPHVERANFVVLRAPDVPSMLVETAFITNPEEERRLKDPKHQQALARAILDGVHTYFSRQPPPGTLYAARAEAAAAATAATGAGGSP